ncbi:hypothetical protein AB9N12_17665 [Bacteroides sp. AN502(2024)]|uniref:hypothetical protein n=1 Tax=Bacteroides sp. AN502(2024) TaxID=3160599 RepID=UPI0035175207
MRPYLWRTRNARCVYVDSYAGNDLIGTGTPDNPYQTLGKAYRGHGTAAKEIICRGRFCEDMSDGDHDTRIQGDYMGAATFDGQDTYLIHGFTLNDIIVENCAPATYTAMIRYGAWGYAGVGRAWGGYFGWAQHSWGVGDHSVIIRNSPLYMGCIGGKRGIHHVVIDSPKICGDRKICYAGNGEVSHFTVHNVPIGHRRRESYGIEIIRTSILARCDFYADEPLRFEECLFTADCRWFLDGEELITEASGGEARRDSLLGQCRGRGVREELMPVFTRCIFTAQTAEELFNNPGAGDLTLRADSPAANPAGFLPGITDSYLGALPPALSIPIMDNSIGIAGTWDEQSAAGILTIAGGAICLDETSIDTVGEVLSKIIRLDTARASVTGILASFTSLFGSHGIVLNDRPVTDRTFAPGDLLPQGRYVVDGNVAYRNAVYVTGNVLAVDEEGTTFVSGLNGTDTGTLHTLEDPNIENVCYLRSTPVIFSTLQAADSLQSGGVYLNTGESPIRYRGRTVVPGESFVAANDTDIFIPPADDPEYRIAIMFDDTRVPAQPWIPAQLFGDYFVCKSGGVVQYDDDGIPVSSGNNRSYQPQSDGGYAEKLCKSVMNDRYCQFKIIARKQ